MRRSSIWVELIHFESIRADPSSSSIPRLRPERSVFRVPQHEKGGPWLDRFKAIGVQNSKQGGEDEALQDEQTWMSLASRHRVAGAQPLRRLARAYGYLQAQRGAGEKPSPYHRRDGLDRSAVAPELMLECTNAAPRVLSPPIARSMAPAAAWCGCAVAVAQNERVDDSDRVVVVRYRRAVPLRCLLLSCAPTSVSGLTPSLVCR